jgi:hypothetical protein
VLHDIERRPLLEQPAGKNTPPVLVAARDVNLDERAGIMFLLPRRGLLAGTQPHDDIADPRRFAGFQHDIARHAVTLVQQSQGRHAFRHRRRPVPRIDATPDIDRHDVTGAGIGVERGFGGFLGHRRNRFRRAAPGQHDGKHEHHAARRGTNHASGVHAS